MLTLSGPSTLARLARIRSQQRRTELIRSRYLLCQLLSYQFNQPLAHWQIEEVEQGPPRILNLPPGWYCSGSHSRTLCGYALSQRPVGLDIEYRLQPRDFMAISRWLFSAAERRALQQASPQLRQQLFYRFWSAKEAIFKGAYYGTPQPLEQIDYYRPQGWTLLEASLRQFSLCIACNRPPEQTQSFYSPNSDSTYPLQLLAAPRLTSIFESQ